MLPAGNNRDATGLPEQAGAACARVATPSSHAALGLHVPHLTKGRKH